MISACADELHAAQLVVVVPVLEQQRETGVAPQVLHLLRFRLRLDGDRTLHEAVPHGHGVDGAVGRDGAHRHRPSLGQERLHLVGRHLDRLALVHAVAHGLGHPWYLPPRRTVRWSVLLAPGAQTEEFILRTLSGCNAFTARSPRLSSVTADGDCGTAHGPRRRGLTFRSRRRTPSRPGQPGRGHLDPAARALTPPRAHRIVGHHGAGLRLPARPGDVGAIYPPSAAVACPSPHHHRRRRVPPSVPRLTTLPDVAIANVTATSGRTPPTVPRGTTGPSSWWSTTRSRIDKPSRRA